MGSDVYGLPSQETYLDSQNFHSDAAKISIFPEYSKLWGLFLQIFCSRGLICTLNLCFFAQRAFRFKIFLYFCRCIVAITALQWE